MTGIDTQYCWCKECQLKSTECFAKSYEFTKNTSSKFENILPTLARNQSFLRYCLSILCESKMYNEAVRWTRTVNLHSCIQRQNSDLRAINKIRYFVSHYSSGWPLQKFISSVETPIRRNKTKKTFLASTRVGNPSGWPAKVKTSIRVQINE